MNASHLSTLATLIPALLLLLWSAHLLLRARRSTTWPLFPATIVESRVVKQGNTRSPRFAFDYTQAGEHRVGRRLWVGPTSLSLSGNWADRVTARYPVGAAVRVAVDPADPAYAVLEPGLRPLHWVLLAAGTGFLAVTLVASVALRA